MNIRVLQVRVGEPPTPVQVDGTNLQELQGLIDGGYLESLGVAPNLVLLCDENGQLNQLPFNFHLFGTPIVGPTFFARTGPPEFLSLTDADIEFLKRLLRDNNSMARRFA